MRKPAFCRCENKDAEQLRVTTRLISAFVFATRIVQSFYFLNAKFQDSSHLRWLYSPVCVGPGRIPRRQVFSQRGSFYIPSKQKNTHMKFSNQLNLTPYMYMYIKDWRPFYGTNANRIAQNATPQNGASHLGLIMFAYMIFIEESKNEIKLKSYS